MKYILLSGGSGTELWPLSTSVRSKQFLKLFENEEGALESSVQKIWKQLKALRLDKHSMFVTNAQQSTLLKDQCGSNITFIEEPMPKNTMAAICLAALYAKDIERCEKDEWLAIVPVDVLVEPSFLQAVQQLPEKVMQNQAEIGLVGITPTYIAPQYGYIDLAPDNAGANVSHVQRLVDKPTIEVATLLIHQGALWNSGVYVVQIKTLLQMMHKFSLPLQYQQFVSQYESFDSISFDYAVMEQMQRSIAYRYEGAWQDIGSWEGISEKLTTEQIGIGSLKGQSKNTHILNELLLPIHVVDVENVIVAANYEGILITNKQSKYEINDAVEDTSIPPLFEKRHWGSYRILEHLSNVNGKDVLIKHIKLSKGKKLSYERHQYRTELWTIIEGKGEFILDNVVRHVQAGDVIHIKAGQLHALKAFTNLQLIEVQTGSPLNKKDSERISLNWDDISQYELALQSTNIVRR